MKYTKEQILKQINELTVTQAKVGSNIKEAIGPLADDGVLNSVIDNLLPFRKTVNLFSLVLDNVLWSLNRQ